MNNEGFTGLDVNRAIEELDYFNECCHDTGRAFIDAFTNLFETLYEKWASPNAVNFTTEQIPIISEEITDYISRYNHILSGANDAAITLAKANGASMPLKYVSGQWDVPFNLGVQRCEESKFGVTGMAKENVRIALDTFNDAKNRALEMLRNIPLGISFYDAEGHLLNTYNEGVNEFIDRFDQIIVTLTSSLATYLETEIDNIRLAKEQAEDTLRA